MVMGALKARERAVTVGRKNLSSGMKASDRLGTGGGRTSVLESWSIRRACRDVAQLGRVSSKTAGQ